MSETARPRSAPVVELGGHEHLVAPGLLPAAARNRMLDEVLAALGSADVTAFVAKEDSHRGPTIGVLPEQRSAALAAIGTALPGPGRYVRESYPLAAEQPVRALTSAAVERVPDRCPAIQVAQFWSVGGALAYGMEYAVRIEFWAVDAEDPELVRSTTTVAHRDLFTPATVRLEGRDRPSVALYDRTFLAEVTFPVDVVYTWVDGDDPAWRERFQRARAAAQGLEYHPEAQAENRYQSRDELKFSLRSLEMYAPWVRHVYLVTDQQVPPWLYTSNDRVTVVDHRDIFTDPSVLPVFNSSAIITQLHHIEGLSEHYLYLNDDMFFGSDTRPEDFWFGSGIAKVFPSRVARAFAPAHAGDAPHFNISKNIRAVLERELGRTITNAIRHTPYPQLRSVLAEIEEKYPEIVAGTAGQRFRHHDDIALDQLFHYYAQATGRAVPLSDPVAPSYDYINVGTAASSARLRRLLARRDYQVFCLNDAPVADGRPIATAEIDAFLNAYFPFASSFER